MGALSPGPKLDSNASVSTSGAGFAYRIRRADDQASLSTWNASYAIGIGLASIHRSIRVIGWSDLPSGA
jgi:hypothetical protein